MRHLSVKRGFALTLPQAEVILADALRDGDVPSK